MKDKNWEELDKTDAKRLKMRINQVKNWLDLYAPPFVKFEVQKNYHRWI